ncbi:MAG: biopolymer transporter ExbD [Thioalkalispiraceae bacterium]|jgi:biopolymer transport protein ExbD
MKKSGFKHLHDVQELNITAFMNLMVILVPFLLITAVFSRMTVLELNLPALEAKKNEQEKVKLQLELVLHPNQFVIQDANLGVIRSFPRTENETNWELFTELLVEIKRRFPEEKSITLLLEPEIDYKTLIQVMDRVRMAEVLNVLEVETIELFPDIAIGDAPAQTTEQQSASDKHD